MIFVSILVTSGPYRKKVSLPRFSILLVRDLNIQPFSFPGQLVCQRQRGFISRQFQTRTNFYIPFSTLSFNEQMQQMTDMVVVRTYNLMIANPSFDRYATEAICICRVFRTNSKDDFKATRITCIDPKLGLVWSLGISHS
jgi:hypothetical protein